MLHDALPSAQLKVLGC